MSNNKYKILVIEDESNILSLVETVLETNDYQVISADTCLMGKTMFMSHNPDLIILDLGLPDMDGIEVIKTVRQAGTTPIIVLSARADEKDKVVALDLGANDYVTKPFGTEELLARVRAALKNNRNFSGEHGSLKGTFCLEELEINYDKRIVYVGGKIVNLTRTEFNIVAFLSEHAGKVLTYAAIIKAVWGYPDSDSIKKLQVNMANIRKKLGMKPGENSYIINELGVGYRMREQNE